MISNTLSLRQRKLLYLIQNHTSHITGQSLAKQLDVSVRTIRSDITEINRNLASCGAQISAEKSKGYYLECSDPSAFQEFFQTDNLLLTREDRIRYLVLQLCLSDVPLNQYDLEDEMYISKTTLKNDIASLKRRYVLAAPHIKIFQKGHTLYFEKDEYKRRSLLNTVLSSDWNYNMTGNTYYNYDFLDADVMTSIITITSKVLLQHAFQIEDPNLVSLNLILAIMYYRVSSGNILPLHSTDIKADTRIQKICDDLFTEMETHFSLCFPIQEKEAVYTHLFHSELMNASLLNFQTVSSFFDSVILEMADLYLHRINQVFQLDFSSDEDFYITLLQYIRYISTPDHVLNMQRNSNLLRRNLLTDCEIAYLFQPIALQYLGYYLEESELLYLAFCISGALEHYRFYHPERKMRTVICCHLNLSAIWSMKRKLLGAFGNYIEIVALLPIYARSTFDFSDIDLVLTTVKKPITDHSGTIVQQISPDIASQDYSIIQAIVGENCLNYLFKKQSKSLFGLLQDAYWHENFDYSDRFSIIEQLSTDFISAGITTPAFTEEILRRESTLTYCYQPGALFLYSLEPAIETKVTVASFKHRILWNSNKIRIIIMACFSSEDSSLLLKLLHEIYVRHNDPDFYRKKRTKEEYLQFFSHPDV